ncbi:MAG TPA: hypothetical protein VJ547_01955 [Candidatus Thermoplasmatota archaeon]|nr:hypothetical protein [Candidatus Thermoplasmatota archaeon]
MRLPEPSGAGPMPPLAVTALVLAAILLTIPVASAPPPSDPVPVAATTPPPPALDAFDALSALLAGVAAGSLAFSHDLRRSRQGS